MKTLLLTLALLTSSQLFAARKMMVIQAYELEGASPQGALGATISILNVSTVEQTVSWSGGFWPNRVLNPSQFTGLQSCGYHTTPMPTHSNATDLGGNKAKLNPGGFITLWCAADSGNNSAPAGHEGVLKMEFTVDEDRGAVMASGAMHVFDRGSLSTSSNLNNWGGSGAGPFQINGGRAF